MMKVVLTLLAALTTAAFAQETVKVAFMGPLTGGAAFIGQEAMGFTDVVIDAFNERTGLNIELVEGDTEINPDTGASSPNGSPPTPRYSP